MSSRRGARPQIKSHTNPRKAQRMWVFGNRISRIDTCVTRPYSSLSQIQKSRPVDSRVCFLYARFIYKTKRLIAPQHNRLIPDMLRHLHIVLPDMAQHGFLALGVFGAHPPGGIGFAKILPALVFPVVLPLCGEIHHYTAFSPHLREKGHRKVTFFDRLQVILYILDKLYFYFAAIGLGGQREWFWYGFCVELAGGRVGYVDR